MTNAATKQDTVAAPSPVELADPGMRRELKRAIMWVSVILSVVL